MKNKQTNKQTAWYWYSDRQVDQGDRSEDPEMNPHPYGQWKKDRFQQMVLVQLAVIM